MNTKRQFFCADGCGEIIAINPQKCPRCGGQIVTTEQTSNQAKKISTSAERAAEWFNKMREAINQEPNEQTNFHCGD